MQPRVIRQSKACIIYPKPAIFGRLIKPLITNLFPDVSIVYGIYTIFNGLTSRLMNLCCCHWIAQWNCSLTIALMLPRIWDKNLSESRRVGRTIEQPLSSVKIIFQNSFLTTSCQVAVSNLEFTKYGILYKLNIHIIYIIQYILYKWRNEFLLLKWLFAAEMSLAPSGNVSSFLSKWGSA